MTPQYWVLAACAISVGAIVVLLVLVRRQHEATSPPQGAPPTALGLVAFLVLVSGMTFVAIPHLRAASQTTTEMDRVRRELDDAIAEARIAVSRAAQLTRHLDDAREEVAAGRVQLERVRRQSGQTIAKLEEETLALSKEAAITKNNLKKAIEQKEGANAKILAMNKRLESSSKMLTAHIAFLKEHFLTESLSDAADKVELLKKQSQKAGSPVVVKGSVDPRDAPSQYALLFVQIVEADLRGDSFSSILGHGTWKAYLKRDETMTYVGTVDVPKEQSADFPKGQASKIDVKQRTLHVITKGVHSDALLAPIKAPKKN